MWLAESSWRGAVHRLRTAAPGRLSTANSERQIARPPPATRTRRLRLRSAVAVLAITRVATDTAGRAVEAAAYEFLADGRPVPACLTAELDGIAPLHGCCGDLDVGCVPAGRKPEPVAEAGAQECPAKASGVLRRREEGRL